MPDFIQLKNFIQQDFSGLIELEIEQESVSAVLPAAQKPLEELVLCLKKYADHHKTVVTIPTQTGAVKIVHDSYINVDNIVAEILKSYPEEVD
jgi:hypothetical protein